MAIDTIERWRPLLQELNPDIPPRDLNLYVEPPNGCAGRTARELQANPAERSKVLLVGSIGSGKSTELRQIGKLLRDTMNLVTLDFGASGVNPESLSAFDVVYACATALLRRVGDDARKAPLFESLKDAYTGGDAEKKRDLGTWQEALEGLAEFTEILGKAAALTGLINPYGGPVGAVLATGGKGIKLLTRGAVVAETSPQGRGLQRASADIAEAVRKDDGRPIMVLVDGLEKMNGKSAERYGQIFEQTDLVADMPWSAVIAAPPCTLTTTFASADHGYAIKTVWGFLEGDLPALERLLHMRVGAANSDAVVPRGILARAARESGGVPRHAMRIAHDAVLNAAVRGADVLGEEDVDAGIRNVAVGLGRGLSDEERDVLAIVHRRRSLPKNNETAARLFATVRILARPGTPPAFDEFVVHPLLINHVRAYMERREDSASS